MDIIVSSFLVLRILQPRLYHESSGNFRSDRTSSKKSERKFKIASKIGV